MAKAEPVVEYIRITDDEQGEDTKLEVPVEEDNTVSLTTLTNAFPGAYGLKYRNPATGAFRALKVDESGRVLGPSDGWSDHMLYVVILHRTENKRKLNSSEGSASKQKKFDEKRCCDLIVLGLAFTCNEEELRAYFEAYGQVLVAQVKRDFKTSQSKGFGFVRFAEYESQVRVLSEKHHDIGGRTCEVKIPDSQKSTLPAVSKKVFVGRVPDNFTKEDIKEYFENYGENCSVHVGQATPKESKRAGDEHAGITGINFVNAHGGDYTPPGKMRGTASTGYATNTYPPAWNGPVDTSYGAGQTYPNSYHSAVEHAAGTGYTSGTGSWRYPGDVSSIPPPSTAMPPPPPPSSGTSTLATGTQQAMQGMNNLNLNSLIGNAVQGAATQQAITNLQQVISQAFMMGIASGGGMGTPTSTANGAPGAGAGTPAGVTEQLMALLGTMQQQQSRDGSGWYPSSSASAATMLQATPPADSTPQTRNNPSPTSVWKQNNNY